MSEDDFDEIESVATATDIPINLPASMVELIVDRAVRTLTDKLAPKATKKLESLVHEAWESTLESMATAKAEALVTDWMMKPRQETNKFGEPNGEVFTFADRMVKLWESHLTEKVDSNGKTQGRDSYRYSDGQSRLQYIIKENAMPELEKIAKQACEQVRSEAKARVQEALAAFLAQQLAPRVELKTIS